MNLRKISGCFLLRHPRPRRWNSEHSSGDTGSFFDTLYDKSKRLLDYMLRHGVTTVEAKSGYGLDWETEKRQLDVVAALDRDHQIDLVSTFMAAHAIPIEYKGRSQEYLDLIVEQMLPKVKEEKLAEFCDIFCEKVSLQQMNLAIFFQKLRRWASSCGSMPMKSNPLVAWMWRRNWNLLAQNT